ncbi:MAG: class II aldolase/adducin family protein [Candidatus Acidiferrales bacterium]
MIRQLAIMMGRDKPIESDVKYRREICKVGRWMYRQGFVVASEGNLSVKLDAYRILVTPAGVCKGRLLPHELIVTDLQGSVVAGSGQPSSELQMHLLCYRLRPLVRAVCHAHPPTATGFAATGRALEEAVLPEVVSVLGKIPLAPYGTPGTRELCAGLEPLVPSYDAILLENHGVVTCGEDLVTAYQHMETVEHFARVMLVAESLGGARLLTHSQIQELKASRTGRSQLNSIHSTLTLEGSAGRMVRAEGYVDLEGKNSKESDQLAFSSCVPHRSLKS